MTLLDTYQAMPLDGVYRSFLENFPKNTRRGFQAEVVEVLEWMAGATAPEPLPVNETTTVGETGFFMALYEGMEQVASWFLSHGADPWKVPDLKAVRDRASGLRFRVYISSSPIHHAFKARLSMGFLQTLLAWDTEKSKAHIRDYKNEYVFGGLLDCLYFRGYTWFHMDSSELFERLRLLIEWGSPVSHEVYGSLMLDYYSKNDDHVLTHDDIRAHIALVATHYMKPDLSAVRIQRMWRQRRLLRAARIAQHHIRARIWNPDYVWANGQTTVQRIFAGKAY